LACSIFIGVERGGQQLVIVPDGGESQFDPVETEMLVVKIVAAAHETPLPSG
jgi:hypothetical protein